MVTRSIRGSHLRLFSTFLTAWSGPVKASPECILCLFRSFFPPFVLPVLLLRSVLSHVMHRAATSCVLPPNELIVSRIRVHHRFTSRFTNFGRSSTTFAPFVNRETRSAPCSRRPSDESDTARPPTFDSEIRGRYEAFSR